MTTKNRPWRQEIELLQNYNNHKTFTYTTTSADAETAVDVAASMEEANKVSLIVEHLFVIPTLFLKWQLMT